MKHNKLLIIIIILFISLILTCFIQNTFFIKTDVVMTFDEYRHFCSYPNTCVTLIDYSSIPKNFQFKKIIIVDCFKMYDAFFSYLRNIITVLLIIFLAVCIRIMASKNEDKNEKVPFSNIIILSCLASYNFIYLYTNNISGIPVYLGLSVVITACIIFLIIYTTINMLIKNQCKSILTSLAICIFIYNINLTHNNIALFDLILFFIFVIYCNTKHVVKFLKYFTIALIALCLFQGFWKKTADFNNYKLQQLSKEQTLKPSKYTITKNPTRDVYIILLDMYAGADTFNQLGFDNSDFINKLKDRGFTVFENINSNYNKTLISLSSFLNFKYIEDLEYNTSSEAISNSELFKMAKQSGYKIYYINSWPHELEVTTDIINEVYTSNYYTRNEVLNLFFNNTIFRKLIYKINSLNPIETALLHLDKIINDKDKDFTKKFVFAHFLMPHEPWLYDENGNELPDEAKNYKKYQNTDFLKINVKSYISFSKFANKKTIQTIDKILNNSEYKPIIIVLGDHGPRIMKIHSGERQHMKELEPYQKSYFNTMLAYYNPEQDTKNIENCKSLINFFIYFAGELFGIKAEHQQDKSFYFYLTANAKNIDKTATDYVLKLK